MRASAIAVLCILTEASVLSVGQDLTSVLGPLGEVFSVFAAEASDRTAVAASDAAKRASLAARSSSEIMNQAARSSSQRLSAAAQAAAQAAAIQAKIGQERFTKAANVATAKILAQSKVAAQRAALQAAVVAQEAAAKANRAALSAQEGVRAGVATARNLEGIPDSLQFLRSPLAAIPRISGLPELPQLPYVSQMLPMRRLEEVPVGGVTPTITGAGTVAAEPVTVTEIQVVEKTAPAVVMEKTAPAVVVEKTVTTVPAARTVATSGATVVQGTPSTTKPAPKHWKTYAQQQKKPQQKPANPLMGLASGPAAMLNAAQLASKPVNDAAKNFSTYMKPDQVMALASGVPLSLSGFEDVVSPLSSVSKDFQSGINSALKAPTKQIAAIARPSGLMKSFQQIPNSVSTAARQAGRSTGQIMGAGPQGFMHGLTESA